MPTPIDDIAGLTDATMGDRAALAIGWTWEIDDTGGYWWDTKNHAPVEWSDWHPSTDHNDAHRLVEECGRRGLLPRLINELSRIRRGLTFEDCLTATPRQITEAAVRVLEDSPASTRN